MSEQNTGAPAPEQASPESSAEEVIGTIEDANEEVNAASDESLGDYEGGSSDVQEASDQELAEVVQDENASDQEVAEAKQEMARRLSLKINGQEQEFDLSSDEDVERIREMAQKGEGADQKFQEAAKIRKQMEAFVQLMQQDPIRALRELGHDPDALTESYMQQRIEEMQKSPEQRELEELRRQLEEQQTEKERLEQERMQAEQQRIQEEYARKLDVEITDALSNSTLPKSPYVVKRLAENLMLAIDKNPNASVADIMPLTEKQLKGEIQQMFGAMPEDVIEQLLGNDVTNRLRQRRLAKMKKTPDTASSIKQTGQAEIKKAQASKEPAKPKSAKDFFKDIGSL